MPYPFGAAPLDTIFRNYDELATPDGEEYGPIYGGQYQLALDKVELSSMLKVLTFMGSYSFPRAPETEPWRELGFWSREMRRQILWSLGVEEDTSDA